MVQPQKTLTTIWQVSDELGNNLKQILAQYDPPNPLGRKRNLTDRAKPGTKRSLLVEAEGGPLAVVVGGANVHDCKLLEATLEAIIVERPKPQDIEQHLCLDKGSDHPPSRDAVDKHHYIPHIRRIAAEKLDDQQQQRHPARL
jgi:hypothetical protein